MAFWESGLVQLRQLWGGLTNPQRLVLIAVLVGLAAGFGSLAVWTGSADYTVLYSRLEAGDAAAVVEKLKSEGVSHRLEDGGRTVLVPIDRVYDLRLSLASEGIPAGGVVGFEIFDESGFGMTNFAQKVNYARALEGELTRTIQRLDGVEAARVHLVLPERRLFEEQAEPASASVVLRLLSGRSLGAKQIQGVVYLVSSSVEGLEPDRITVVDSRGEVLYQAAGEEAGVLATNQLEFKRAYEKDVEDRVRTMLERVLGPGAAVVQVAADFDFDRVEETSETFDPEAVVVRSEERVTETSSGTQGPAGVPGVASNLDLQPEGDDAGSATRGPGTSSNRETETVNYEVSKTVTRVQRAQGDLRRVTVAAAVDGTYRDTEGGGREFVPRTAEELAQIRSLVEKAVGIDLARGDAVEVTSIPFRPADDVEPAPTNWWAGRYLPLVRYAMTAALVLVLLVTVVRPLVKWLTRAGGVPEVSEPVTVAEMERRLEGEADPIALEENAPSETRRRETLKKRLMEMFDAEPSVVAQLLRSWISE